MCTNAVIPGFYASVSLFFSYILHFEHILPYHLPPSPFWALPFLMIPVDNFTSTLIYTHMILCEYIQYRNYKGEKT